MTEFNSKDEVWRGFNFYDDLIEDIHVSQIKLAKAFEKITEWLEHEVEDLQTYADSYVSKSNLSLSGSDFINVGKHETAQELLRLIKEEWQVDDE